MIAIMNMMAAAVDASVLNLPLIPSNTDVNGSIRENAHETPAIRELNSASDPWIRAAESGSGAYAANANGGAFTFCHAPVSLPLNCFGVSAYAKTESGKPTISDVVSAADGSLNADISSNNVDAFATRMTVPMTLGAEEFLAVESLIATRCASAIDTPPESENGSDTEPESTTSASCATFLRVAVGGFRDVVLLSRPLWSNNQIAL